MTAQARLLDDEAMRAFIANGYVTIKTDLPRQFHDELYEKTGAVFAEEGNPGNNLLPRLPDYQRVFDDPGVRGAMSSILGPDYYMHPHRHCHFNPPGSEGQNMHKDSWARRHHHTRWTMALYYPQDVPLERGPTGVVSGTHFHNKISDADLRAELPLTGEAGTVTIVHYDLWHRAMPNSTDQKRFMAKFLFTRMTEPEAPTWDSQGGEWDADDLKHRSMWNWHSGRREAELEGGDGAISDHIANLAAESEADCLGAAYALAARGEAALPDLLKALESASEEMRRNAGYALTAMGHKAVPALIDTLAAADDKARAGAANVLGDIGLPAQEAVPALTKTLGDPTVAARRHAAESLGLLNGAARSAASSLVDVLRDEDVWVRRNAALSLARLGRDAEEVLPALIEALHDDNRYVCAKSALALQRIDTPEAQNALMDFLLTARWCPLTDKTTPY